MRTIETIIDCHKMATERRKAGKPIWDGTVKIKHLFENLDSDSDTYEQDIAKAANKIAEIFINQFGEDHPLFGLDMSLTIEAMRDAKESEEEDFNWWLENIYDWCDYHRIWVE